MSEIKYDSEFITIKAETIDPTGVVITKAQMMLENTVPRDATRILLEIGDSLWMTTDKGLRMKRIVPHPDYDLDLCDECFQMTNHLDGVCQKCKDNTEEDQDLKYLMSKKDGFVSRLVTLLEADHNKERQEELFQSIMRINRQIDLLMGTKLKKDE